MKFNLKNRPSFCPDCYAKANKWFEGFQKELTKNRDILNKDIVGGLDSEAYSEGFRDCLNEILGE